MFNDIIVTNYLYILVVVCWLQSVILNNDFDNEMPQDSVTYRLTKAYTQKASSFYNLHTLCGG